MSTFYHIFISPKDDVTADQVQKVMNLALDWFRCDSNNWIVYTKSDAKKWYSRFQKYVEPGGHIFICKLDIDDYYGLMPKTLWDWLGKKR
jgi:hypothetical protein